MRLTEKVMNQVFQSGGVDGLFQFVVDPVESVSEAHRSSLSAGRAARGILQQSPQLTVGALERLNIPRRDMQCIKPGYTRLTERRIGQAVFFEIARESGIEV